MSAGVVLLPALVRTVTRLSVRGCQAMNVLIFAESITSATLRHEVGVGIGDPFLYVETGGRRIVVTSSLEEERLARAAPELERLMMDSLGLDELLAERSLVARGRP
jgi:hypothetical protein